MPNRPDAEDEWARTRAETVLQTQLMGDKEAYLGGQNHAIGRRINAEQHELFVVCDPSEAMHQQFELRTPDFLALHDLKGADSLRLLRGLARALRRKVQKLVIRRQGFGVALATIEFVELPGPADGPVCACTAHSRIHLSRPNATRWPTCCSATVGWRSC